MANRNNQPNAVDTLMDVGVGGDLFGATAAPSPATQMARPNRKMIMVKHSQIVQQSPHQVRVDDFDPETCEEDRALFNSVKANNVIQAITLKQLPGAFGQEPTYEIVAGHRRTAASRLAGYETIPAQIAGKDEDTCLLTLVENTGGKPLSAYEKYLGLMEVSKEHPDWDVPKLAETTSIPAPTIYQLREISEKACPALLGLFRKGMGQRAVVMLQPIFNRVAPGDQQRFADAYVAADLSSSQAELVRNLVGGGAEPFAALEMSPSRGRSARKEEVTPVADPAPFPASFEASEPSLATAQAEEGETNPAAEATEEDQVVEEMLEGLKVKDLPMAPVVSQIPESEPDGNGLPDLSDDAAMQVLGWQTGLAPKAVREMTKTAISTGADLEDLRFACFYVAAGGDRKRAIQVAKVAKTHPKVASMMHKYQAVRANAIGLAEKLRKTDDGQDTLEFLEVVFGTKQSSGK